MGNLDIRWIQRLNNYSKALERLKIAIQLVNRGSTSPSELNDLLQEGLVQRFEYTQELAWKLLKDYAEYQGYTNIMGSRDAIRKALEIGLLTEKEWMDTIVARNFTSHCYDDAEFQEVLFNIIHNYFPLFDALEKKMKEIKSKIDEIRS